VSDEVEVEIFAATSAIRSLKGSIPAGGNNKLIITIIIIILIPSNK
jgi:hypothetical protein